ncbi:MAG TPA: hypothetical protein VFR25_05205 [Candidatus Eisenbacteria bacterium]|nr:hypothetical protein [Candidatus Eisenbacteria bacterium]
MRHLFRTPEFRVLAVVLGLVTLYATYACSKGGGRLAQPYPYMVGDDVATRMSGIIRVVAGLEANTMVYYDRKDHRIVASVVGTASDVAGAERELDSFLQAVRQFVFPYAKRAHGLDLSDSDVTLVYYNDGGEAGSPYEVVRRENGAYKPAPGGAPADSSSDITNPGTTD